MTLGALVIMLMFGEKPNNAVLYAFVLFVARCGSSLAFGFIYALHVEIFPP